MKYQSKETIDAIGFQELVEIGLATKGANIVNGVPWSFDYKGRRCTHEDDDQYLIGSAIGIVKFNRGQFLVSNDEKGILCVMSADDLHESYSPVGYRDLRAGEEIIDGDEYLNSAAGCWEPVGSASVGRFVGRGSVGFFRRKDTAP